MELIEEGNDSMEELLKQLIGKKIDVSSGASSGFRGAVTEVKNGVLYLRSEDEKVIYVPIEKIAAVYECDETHSRPGFVV